MIVILHVKLTLQCRSALKFNDFASMVSQPCTLISYIINIKSNTNYSVIHRQRFLGNVCKRLICTTLKH